MTARPNEAQEDYWNTRGLTWVDHQELLDHQLAEFGALAVSSIAPQPGERVLDVGCGCGATSLLLHDAVSPGGEVVGVDISAPMLDRARERATGRTGIEFVVADAQFEPLGGPYDAITSRFGVMFFSDSVQAFTNLRAAAVPRGRLGFVCWQGVEHNPWMTVANRAAMTEVEFPPREPNAADPFAFGDPHHVRSILDEAGWQSIVIEPHTSELPVGAGRSVAETVDFLIDLGPAKGALAGKPAAVYDRVHAAMTAALEPHAGAGGVRLPGAVWVVTARA